MVSACSKSGKEIKKKRKKLTDEAMRRKFYDAVDARSTDYEKRHQFFESRRKLRAATGLLPTLPQEQTTTTSDTSE